MCSAVMHTDVFLGDFDPDTAAERDRPAEGAAEHRGRGRRAGRRQPERVRGVLPQAAAVRPRRAARRTRGRPWSRRCSELGEHAVGVGAQVFLEPLNRYEDYLVNTLADAVSIVDEVDSPGVAVIADTYHMSIEEADCAASIIAAGDAYPARPARRQQPARAGRRALRLAARRSTALEQIGYDGWLAMECGLSGPTGDVLPRVAKLLRKR